MTHESDIQGLRQLLERREQRLNALQRLDNEGGMSGDIQDDSLEQEIARLRERLAGLMESASPTDAG